MKYQIFTIGLVTALLAACSVKEMDVNTPTGEDFFAWIENASTKVFVDDDLMVLWHADDRVSIFNKYTFNQEYRFTGQTGANSGTFKKVPSDDFITGNALENIYAVYPYQASTEISNQGVITLTLPATQAYAENSFGIGANTMVSCTEGNELLFKNLCGYVMLKLYGNNVSVKSISLKGNNNEPLAGLATVNASVNAAPTLSFDASAAKEITLTFGTSVPLGTTAETATTFWLVVPPTTFSKGITITVKDNKNGVFEKSTTKSLEIRRNTLSRMTALEVVTKPSVPVPDAIDLGLPSGLKWASFNLGASKPEEYGDYYAWGETEPYYSSLNPLTWKEGKEAGYDLKSYKWCMGTSNTYKKYNSYPSYGYNGFADYKYNLDPEDDAAYVNLGGQWRLPSEVEITELRESCSWVKKTRNGVTGFEATGPNGNSIFFPAAGSFGVDNDGKTLYYESVLGLYSSYSLSSSQYAINNGAILGLYCLEGNDIQVYDGAVPRSIGNSIRPVYGERAVPVSVESISLDQSEIELFVGQSYNLSATVLPDNATMKNVFWSSSDSSIASVNTGSIQGNSSIQGNKMGTVVITATTVDGGKTASCVVNVVYDMKVPEIVDLGSAGKWASFNLGAANPEEYGDYFAWGEPEPDGNNGMLFYGIDSYKWYDTSSQTYTKYNTDPSIGLVDNKTRLEPEDDAAHVLLGGAWRMPTAEDFNKLVTDCTWVIGSLNGVNGFWACAGNGNKIFLPKGGWVDGMHLPSYLEALYEVGEVGAYWSSDLNAGLPYQSYSLGLDNSAETGSSSRYKGLLIRPIYDSE